MSNSTQVVTYGVDLAKPVFHIGGLNAQGKRVVSKKLRRTQTLEFFSNHSPCPVAMEASAG